MEEKILKVLNNQLDGFFCPNQSDFYNDNITELFSAIYNLIEKGMIKRRNCEGLAYEYVDR